MKLISSLKDKISNMTLKRRIFIANTGMVLFSLLILLAVAAGLVDLFKGEILRMIGQNSILADHTYEVQTVFHEIDEYGTDWEVLGSKLEEYGYKLYISDAGHDKVYSTVRHMQMEVIEELESIGFQSDRIELSNMEGMTILKMRTRQEEKLYNVYAVCYERKDSFFGIDKGMFELFILMFLVAGSLTVFGLVLVSQLVTKRLTRKILEPVNKLTCAANRINAGNLDEPIDYEKKDEFLNVCTTFDLMQRNLKGSIERSEAYERARTEMVSGISHDLRTPLTSMKGFIKGIIDGVANTPEKQAQYLKISYQKTCDMEVLLQKLFFFSKLETGNMPFYKQHIEFVGWLHKYIMEKQQEFQESRVTIRVLEDGMRHMVDVDVEQMKRVFDNLIENSIKYAGVEALVITCSIQRNKEYETIVVADNGNGVEDEKLSLLFEQFYRGDESRNSKKEGSGLGLYVCKYIVAEHGGTIAARNDNGLRITIQLPRMELLDAGKE